MGGGQRAGAGSRHHPPKLRHGPRHLPHRKRHLCHLLQGTLPLLTSSHENSPSTNATAAPFLLRSLSSSSRPARRLQTVLALLAILGLFGSLCPLLCSGRCLSLRVLVLRCQFESWCLIRIINDSIVDACMGVAAASLLTSNGRGLSSKTITAKFGPGPTADVAGFRARWCKCSFRMAPVQSQRRYVVATWAS